NLLGKNSYKEGKSRTRYAYAPTKAGKELILPLFALMQWGDKFYREDKAPLTIIDPDTAEKLTVKLSTSDGKEVPLDKIKIIIN
ncbi:MAG: hypothetical protein KAR62_00795, partial [Sphingomonadales bacterium]|nr:hypothetical protein [Sphingomonadales bacterium]